MDNEPMVRNWQRRITETCTGILGRPLTAPEAHFITSRGGFLALEMIEDHVRSLAGQPDVLANYLNSENGKREVEGLASHRDNTRMGTLSPLLNPNIQFVAEDEAAAMGRYSGFASHFYAALYAAYPGLRGRFRFFRDQASDDVWSVCETADYAFGVQLDPDIEVICIWDAGWFDEIGTWMPDPVARAVQVISERVIRCSPDARGVDLILDARTTGASDDETEGEQRA